ncbi:MAG: hypothetical protein QOE00_740 [Ilumatobacteraceae bacterium]
MAAGTLLSLVAVGVVLFVFSTTDKRVGVLQVVRDIPAGAQLAAGDVRSVELSTDPSLAVVQSSDIAAVVGRYAKVRIVSGGLLATGLLQAAPLVATGAAVVAVSIPEGELPAGLRERSQVQVVIPPRGDNPAIISVVGRVVGLPSAADSTTGQMSVSVEVAVADAVVVASAETVRLVLLDPGVDPAGVAP